MAWNLKCQTRFGGDEASLLMAMHRASRVGRPSSQCRSNLAKVRNGDLVMKRIPSFYIAFKEKIFSEGAERMVRRACFLDPTGCFTGQRYVAKESRFFGE